MNLFNTTLATKRQDLIKTIVNNTNLRNLDMLISFELRKYESVLQESFHAGIPIVPSSNLQESIKWSTLKSVFFSSTVLTTIGEFLLSLSLYYNACELHYFEFFSSSFFLVLLF